MAKQVRNGGVDAERVALSAAAKGASREQAGAAPSPFPAPPGRAVAIGRDGKPIYRQVSSGVVDPFAIDETIVPPGWVYQWCRYSVHNQVDHTHLARLARIGRWTPVPAERHDGMFLPPGTKGSIIHDGLILMERPIELHREAVADDKRAADEALRLAYVQRGLMPKSSGIDTQTPAAKEASFVRRERATAADMQALADVPRGQYSYDRQSID